MEKGLEDSDFVRVCSIDEVLEGEPRPFAVEGADDPDRMLVRDGTDIFSLGRICSHQGADLSEGVASGGVLWCPLHSSGFDLRSGTALHPPASEPVPVYHVRIENGDVYVSVRPRA